MNAIEIATKLITFKTITPKDDGIFEYLENFLQKNKFHCRILSFGQGKTQIKNLYAFYKSGDGPNICFAGHTDVVPPGNLSKWNTNPFEPMMKNGFLYGRGASDMKGAIGSFMDAGIKFTREKKFKGTISYLITGDEEGKANYGTKKVIDWMIENKIKLDFCIVGEPTNPNFLGEMAKIGRRGSLNGELTVFGKQGHVAYPERSNNPIKSLLKYSSKLLEPIDKGDKLFQSSNLEITSIDVNNKVTNLIPSEAKLNFNVRFNSSFSSTSLIKLLKERLNQVGKHYSINFSVSGESFINKSDKLTDTLSYAIFEILKIKPKMSTSGGTSDARFISKICPVIEFGLVGKTMHQINENVSLMDIKALSMIYQKFLEKMFL